LKRVKSYFYRTVPLMENYEAFAYFLMRVSFGAVVLTHGIPKLLGIPHGSIENPMASTTHLIGQVLGLPFAEPMAYFVMLLETLGAVMIIVGCSTRAVSILMAIEMMSICFALGPTWSWVDKGIEYPCVLLILSIYLFVRGSGPLAIDNVLYFRNRITET